MAKPKDSHKPSHSAFAGRERQQPRVARQAASTTTHRSSSNDRQPARQTTTEAQIAARWRRAIGM